jgi:hypothetical protein
LANNDLYVFLDTASLDDAYSQSKNKLDRLLLYHNKKPFIFERSSIESVIDIISRVKKSKFESADFDIKTIKVTNGINNKLFEKPLTEGEKQFLRLIVKCASTNNNFKSTYVDNAVFVTENHDFLGKFIATDNKSDLHLRAFFPTLRLVDLDQALEVLDIFAKSNGYYFGPKTEGDMTSWYGLFLCSKLSHGPAFHKNVFINSTPSEFVQALVFRFLKILLCIDYMGEQHYFGRSRMVVMDAAMSIEGVEQLKKNGLYNEKLKGFVNLDDDLLIFYHMEYLISLVTGIFDNLAIETANKYHISLARNRISLSKDAGREFLKDLANKDPVVKNHIDSNRDFINLIYDCRERVVHREGLKRKMAPLAAHWSNFIEIDHAIKNYIKNCGDKQSRYKQITEWGIVVQQGNIYLDPFYFAKHVFLKLTAFSDDYLKLINFPKFSDGVNQSHELIQELNYFQNNSLRIY